MTTRIVKFLRELFTTTPPPVPGDLPDEPAGGLGVREPRRPVGPRLSGAVAFEPPPGETHDVWAVGEEETG